MDLESQDTQPLLGTSDGPKSYRMEVGSDAPRAEETFPRSLQWLTGSSGDWRLHGVVDLWLCGMLRHTKTFGYLLEMTLIRWHVIS
jgi:hypothetical protein